MPLVLKLSLTFACIGLGIELMGLTMNRDRLLKFGFDMMCCSIFAGLFYGIVAMWFI